MGEHCKSPVNFHENTHVFGNSRRLKWFTEILHTHDKIYAREIDRQYTLHIKIRNWLATATNNDEHEAAITQNIDISHRRAKSCKGKVPTHTKPSRARGRVIRLKQSGKRLKTMKSIPNKKQKSPEIRRTNIKANVHPKHFRRKQGPSMHYHNALMCHPKRSITRRNAYNQIIQSRQPQKLRRKLINIETGFARKKKHKSPTKGRTGTKANLHPKHIRRKRGSNIGRHAYNQHNTNAYDVSNQSSPYENIQKSHRKHIKRKRHDNKHYASNVHTSSAGPDTDPKSLHSLEKMTKAINFYEFYSGHRCKDSARNFHPKHVRRKNNPIQYHEKVGTGNLNSFDCDTTHFVMQRRIFTCWIHVY